MSLKINWESLQSHYIENKIIEYLTNFINQFSNISNNLGFLFQIDSLKFGNISPKIDICSIKDIDLTIQWNLQTHEINLPNLPKINFQAPFQSSIKIDWQGDFSSIFSILFSFNILTPNSIKFLIRSQLLNISFNGLLNFLFLGDNILIYFDKKPEYNFLLELSIGINQPLFDQNHIKSFLIELIDKWMNENIIYPNSLKIPFV